MTIFSKYRTPIVSTVSAAFGGLAVYYGMSSLHGFPKSKWDTNWDKREPSALVKPLSSDDSKAQNEYNDKIRRAKSNAIRHVILIRHGQYNLAGRTDKEKTLTALGEKQALITGQRLKELDHPYTSIVRSTMTRATQTSKLIEKFLPNVPVSDSSLLEEGAPCLPEPKHLQWKPELYVFRDGSRIEAAFRKYIHRAPPHQTEDSYDILVCHGNVIRYFICRALQLPPNAWLRFSINHASITWLSISPSGKVSLKEYSDVGHMPPDLITTT